MTHPMYTEKIGKEIELLITTIEEMENEKKHIDILSAEEKTEIKTETAESVTNANSENTFDDNAMDLLVDSFDNLKQKSSPCTDDQTSCCSKNIDDSYCGSNDFPKQNMNTSPVIDKSCNKTSKKINNINESISKELEKMQSVIVDSMSKIMENFDDDLKNKIMQQLR